MQDVRSANNMNDATQPQHFTLRTGSSTSGSPASSRASSQSGFRVQAQSNNTPRTFSWGLNPVALPQSQPSSRASSSSGRRSLPPPSFDQLQAVGCAARNAHGQPLPPRHFRHAGQRSSNLARGGRQGCCHSQSPQAKAPSTPSWQRPPFPPPPRRPNTSTWTILRSPARTPPGLAAHASASNSLSHSRRGHGRGRAAGVEVPRVRRNPLC